MIKLELEKYQQSRNKPSDFDSFWEQNIKQAHYSNLNIIDSEYQVNSVECRDLYFHSYDESEIHCKYCYPSNKEIKGVILLFHGYHVNSGAWFEKVALASQSYAVIALDSRGQSGKSQDNLQTKGSTLKGLVIKGINEGIHNLYLKSLYLDAYLITKIAQDLHPNKDIYTSGESQGGALALIASSLNPEVKLCLTTYPYLCDFELAYKLDKAYDGIDNYFKFEDPLADNYQKLFNTLDYVDVMFFVDRIKADVHLFIGGTDEIAPLDCQLSMYNNLLSNKKYYYYPKRGHEYLTFSEDIKLKIILKKGEQNVL